MSGGVEMERVCSVGVGGNGGVAQNLLGDATLGIDSGGGGGREGRKREDPDSSTKRRSPAGKSQDVVMSSSVGATSGDSPLDGPSCNNKKQRRMRRYHHHHSHNRKHLGKRIRRNTQPAPNNTNEFLMQEHDHLFHLDLDTEDWDVTPAPADPDELNLHGHHHPYESSSDEDQDYLSREFSATYDVVNAERLSLMSKTELISEYQMLEERVETLERKLKSALRSNSRTESEDPHELTPPIVLLSEDEKVRLVQEEVTRLRDENRKIRADNKWLRKLMYGDPTFPMNGGPGIITAGVAGASIVGDRAGSTDSGGGSGSGSDICT